MKFALLLLSFALPLSVAADPAPIAGVLVQDSNGFLQFTHKPGQDAETYRMLENQQRLQDSGNRNPTDYQNHISSGQARAAQMVEMLKDEEMQKALRKVTFQGKQILQENPDLKNPLTIVAGAFALWAGRTIRIFHSDHIKLSTRLEGRARTGDFNLESPFFNGRLSFSGNDGLNVSMNRSIASINTNAAFAYSVKQQSFSGQISHPLAPNLDLSFGAVQLQQTNQTDGQAKLEYRLSF
ncbi:MAG: hypothetical protein H7333_09925 [Bdellovibrionales bacterium]|nr:hypothetical protein [Oligoflexia bacterium]